MLTYGVALGRVETDSAAYVHMPCRRARRWHMLALLAAALRPPRRPLLAERYGCEVIHDVSLQACRAVAERLEASVSPARMAELATAPAAVLRPPEHGCPLTWDGVPSLEGPST